MIKLKLNEVIFLISLLLMTTLNISTASATIMPTIMPTRTMTLLKVIVLQPLLEIQIIPLLIV